jgi:hypothetical protein
MLSIIRVLREWQDLIGAIIGGMLGVFGALIVARGLTGRERRSASRMLQKDLFGVEAMVSALTHGRKVSLDTLGEQLILKLAFNRIHLSTMFEAQMSIIFGSDRALAGLLAGFHQYYSSVEYYMGNIERARTVPVPDPAAAANERGRVPAVLRGADEYARAALYLLFLEEMGIWRRVCERARRRWRATQEDKDSQALIDRLATASGR